MSKELTINLDDELYTGLMNLVGEQKVCQFIESVLRLHFKKDSSEIYDVELSAKLTKEDISDIRAARRARKGDLVSWEDVKERLDLP